jgi:hypothetical protein
VASQFRNVAAAGGAPQAAGQPARPPRRRRLSWLRALPLLARPVALTMPWVTLITGCLAGVVYLAVMAWLAGAAAPLGQGAVHLAFLPAVAALAFVPRAPFRPLTQTTPVPCWVAPAGHLLLAAPILALTCWAELRITADAVPLHALGHAPAVYPLLAQLAGWCAVTAGAAACVGRSRYADLSGAVAAPVSFAVITLAWHLPVISRFLADPPGTAHDVTVAWYAVAGAALALTCVALQDQWHRYTRRLRLT